MQSLLTRTAALLLAMNASVAIASPSSDRPGYHALGRRSNCKSGAHTTLQGSGSPSTSSIDSATIGNPSPTSSASQETSSGSGSVSVPTTVPGGSQPAQLCGDGESTIIDLNGKDFGLLVANQRLNSNTPGTVCTTYDGLFKLPNGKTAVKFHTNASLEHKTATENDNQYYSKVAIDGVYAGKHQLKDIKSIPTTYSYERTNTTVVSGDICFDMLLGPTADDSTSPNVNEIMIWLSGSQAQPFAHEKPSIGTFDAYGTTWDVFQGINVKNNNIPLTTALPRQDFGAYSGTFDGDLLEMLNTITDIAKISKDGWLNSMDAGTEQFYGYSSLTGYVAMAVN